MLLRVAAFVGLLIMLQGCALSPLPTESSAPQAQSSEPAKTPAKGGAGTSTIKLLAPEYAIAAAYAACIGAYEGKSAEKITNWLSSLGFVRKARWANHYYSAVISRRKSFLGFWNDHTLDVFINPKGVLINGVGCDIVASEGSTYFLLLTTGLVKAFEKKGYQVSLRGEGQYHFRNGTFSGEAAIEVIKEEGIHQSEVYIRR